MSKVFLWGTILDANLFDGKTTKFAAARVKEAKSSHRVVAFAETATALAAATGKYAIVTGYLNNKKNDDGTWEQQVVCQSVELLQQQNEETKSEEIPF